jgi:transposase
VILDEAGKRVSSRQVVDDPLGFVAAVSEAWSGVEVVLEATWGSYWAVDVLEEAGFEVHLAHPVGDTGVSEPSGEERRT